MTRKRIVIISLIVLAIIGLIIWAIAATQPKEDPSQNYLKDAVTFTVDEDTGERVSDDPNLTDQSTDNRTVIVLGIEELINRNIVNAQIDYVKDTLNTYSKERLKNAYETITIRPQGLTYTDGVITTTIRLGQTETVLPISMTLINTGETRVVVSDPDNKFGGTFDSGGTNLSAD